MYLLICDETNLQQKKFVDFFVYGGLIVHADRAHSLSTRIAEIREARGFRPTDKLKFQNASRPRHIEKADWDAAKKEVIAACRDHDVKLMACLVHHKIAAGQKDKLIDWQLNTVLEAFNLRLLDKENDHGIVVIDRLGGAEYGMLKTKFTQGAELTKGYFTQLDRVVLFASTCDGASHLASATDVLLGTLGYCINQKGNTALPKKLFPTIRPMIYQPRWNPAYQSGMWEYGLMLNPKIVQFYGHEYRSLKAHIASLDPET